MSILNKEARREMAQAQYLELMYVLASEKWLSILQKELSCDQ